MSKKKSVVQLVSTGSAPQPKPVEVEGSSGDFKSFSSVEAIALGQRAGENMKNAFTGGPKERQFFCQKMQPELRQEIIQKIAKGEVHLRGPSQEIVYR